MARMSCLLQMCSIVSEASSRDVQNVQIKIKNVKNKNCELYLHFYLSINDKGHKQPLTYR